MDYIQTFSWGCQGHLDLTLPFSLISCCCQPHPLYAIHTKQLVGTQLRQAVSCLRGTAHTFPLPATFVCPCL